jgi:hypothetical protein
MRQQTRPAGRHPSSTGLPVGGNSSPIGYQATTWRSIRSRTRWFTRTNSTPPIRHRISGIGSRAARPGRDPPSARPREFAQPYVLGTRRADRNPTRTVHDASTGEKSVSYPPSLAMRHQTSTHPKRFHLAHPPAADYTGPLSPYEEVSRLLRYCSIDDEEYYSALKHRLSRLANQIAEQNTRFMKRCWPAPAPGAKCCANPPPRRLRDTDRHPHRRNGGVLPTPRKVSHSPLSL